MSSSRRQKYEKLILVAGKNNRQQLAKTLYLMYALDVELKEYVFTKLSKVGEGYSNEARLLYQRFWNPRRVKRFVRQYAMTLDHKTRCFSKVSWLEFPMTSSEGPFTKKAEQWIYDNVSSVEEDSFTDTGLSNMKELPKFDTHRERIVAVLDRIDSVK